MRRTIIAPEEHYHIFNRGNNKKLMFFDDADRIRFLSSVLLFQSPVIIKNIKRLTKMINVQNSVLHIMEEETLKEIISTRFIELISFVLMPNHFHLLIREVKEKGIERYMHRVQVSYSKYFNIRYKNTGHHFQGQYKVVHVTDNDQLLYLSTYVHRNPREMISWRNREHMYPWSSFPDYLGNNRWGDFIKTDIILKQFKNSSDYKKFTDKSIAKTFKFSNQNLLLD